MWGVPVDHEYFSHTNTVQWMWYHHNDMKDYEDSYIKYRGMLEYHASFSEPNRVSEVIGKRSEAEGKSEVIGTTDDAEFNASLKSLFGRDAGLGPAIDTGEMHNMRNMLDNIAEYEERQRLLEKMPVYNYSHWVDFDLE